MSCRELVEAVYAALATGDEPALRAVLDEPFEAEFIAGMPLGLGGTRRGADAAIAEGWWPIGAAFAVRAQPEQWLSEGDDRLVVIGTYRGAARSTGRSFEAGFAHIWRSRGDKLVEMRQITDGAAWATALE